MHWLAGVERLGGEGGISRVRRRVRRVETIQVDPEDIRAERMGGGMMAPSSRSIPTPIKALSQSRPHPTSPPDMDLAELTDQIF